MPTANLTDGLVKALKCDAGKTVVEHRDTAVPGLELRVWAGGAKTWRLHYTRRSDSKRRVAGLGSYPALTLKEARRKAKGLQAEIENEVERADPAAGKRIRREALTFAELADEWIERHAKPNKAARSVQDNRSMLDRHILPEIGAYKAIEITKRDVIELIDTVAGKLDARSAKGEKPRKLSHRPNRIFELVRSIFRWAVGRDLLQADPTYMVKAPIKKEKPRERELAPEEIATLWKALDRAPVARRFTKGVPRGTRVMANDDLPMTRPLAIAIKLALATGQRIGEVTGIKRSELVLDDAAPLWVIPGGRSKNGHSNRVPLSPIALRLLDEAFELAGASDWAFPGSSGMQPIDPHAPTKALDRARPVIGLDNFRIHDLRRTAATRMAEMGINPHTISLILNHVSARSGSITAKVYVQYSYDREKRDALNAWGERLQSIVAVTPAMVTES
jgi:integrase